MFFTTSQPIGTVACACLDTSRRRYAPPSQAHAAQNERNERKSKAERVRGGRDLDQPVMLLASLPPASLCDVPALHHAEGVDGIARCASAWNRHEVSHGINAEHWMESADRRHGIIP